MNLLDLFVVVVTLGMLIFQLVGITAAVMLVLKGSAEDLDIVRAFSSMVAGIVILAMHILVLIRFLG